MARVLGAIAVTAVCVGAASAPQQPPLTEVQTAVFALLDEFDPLDTSKLPFVRVVVPWQYLLPLDDGANERFGFLQWSDGKRFLVRYLDLGQEHLEVRKEQHHGLPPVWFEPADMHTVVLQTIHELERHRREQYRDYSLLPDDPMHPVAKAVLLARACARAGRHEDVQALWEQLPKDYGTRDVLTGKFGAHELAGSLADRLALDFTDPSYSWQKLVDRHLLWLERFPDYYYPDPVRKRHEQLWNVIKSRAARGSTRDHPPTPADLVFALHDQTDAEINYLGFDVVHPLVRSRLDVRSPLDRVIALDLEAVPPLIDALDDHSVTRCIAHSTRGLGSFSPLEFRALADHALCCIAGFRPPGEDRRTAWQEWLARARREGARKIAEWQLDARNPSGLWLYLRRWPDGFGLLVAALRAAPAEHRRTCHLVYWLHRAELVDPALLDLCRHHLTECDWQERLDLTRALLEHGYRDGIDLVFRTWRLMLESANDDKDAANACETMLGFLVSCGEATVWQGIAERTARPILRKHLAIALCEPSFAEAPAWLRGPASTEAAAAAKRCLNELLTDDTSLGEGLQIRPRPDPIFLHEATVADLGAHTLTTWWPDEFPFDAKAAHSVRQRQIAALRGQPLAPTPAAALPPNRIRRVDIDATAASLPAPVLDALRAMHDRELTTDSLVDAAIAAARATSRQLVALKCERTGLGDGTAVTAAIEPLLRIRDASTTETISGAGPGPGWQVHLVITIGGVACRVRTITARRGNLTNAAQLRAASDLGDVLDWALAAPAATGVEITLAVRTQ